MSKLFVQCPGSGKSAGASLNAKKANCSTCQKSVEVASNGRLRKHMRMATTRDLKRRAKA